jgi:XTP/dITP diphosphohydrolase
MDEIQETGSSFRENAELKAHAVAIHTGQLSVADDSGLEVEALANAPGIYSARYGGVNAGYDVKIAKLLSELDATGDKSRRARFVCAMALADPQSGILHAAEGICAGSIADAPRGSNGFGYDPVFLPNDFQQTFGELSNDVKQTLSHRARAAELIIRYLLHFTTT